MEKLCVSCGMPMKEKKDFAKGDQSLDYCIHCSLPDGSMKSYEEAFAGMVKFMINTQGVTEKAAEKAVSEMMAKLPAWQEINHN